MAKEIEDFYLRLPIRLGQFLKLANLAENGAHARELIQDGVVEVNGEVETRRSHELKDGDVITLDDGYNAAVSIRVREE
ncbi:MAG: RNA-binding S4 domain-containing protein [Arcanobacterium sp.]|nr:RNA-binding S4 domain-containing protein [Arcanobacterium sp.]